MSTFDESNRPSGPSAARSARRTPSAVLRIVVPYAVFASIWILASDSLLLALIRDPSELERWSIGKGWAFVVVTALLLTALLRRELHARASGVAGLVQSEKRYRLLFESNPHPMWVFDAETLRFLAVNDAAVAQYGYSREEFVGMTLAAIRPPEDVAAAIARASSISEELSEARVWHHRRKDGNVFLAEVRSHRIEFEGRPARLVLALDVTERHRAEERFRELAETIEDVFWIIDPDQRRTIYVSPAYERVWGRTCESLYRAPESWLEAIVPEDRARVRDAATPSKGEYSEEYRILRPDGELRWIRDRAYAVRGAAGRVERIVGVARDISSERRLEDQLRLSQKLEAVGQLAGGVAHDFNNLLAVILLNLEMLNASSPEDPRIREGLEEIRGAAERAAGLTRQLLLFSRRQVIESREVDLNDIVGGIVKLLRRLLGEDIQLRVDLHSTALLTLADPGMLEQVLMNLAVNARDAMPHGGRLVLSTAELEIDASTARLPSDAHPGRYVRVTVADSGEGIPPEVLPRIFEPFFTTKDPGKGTGLGLATVFGIVKQHGGWIHVSSVAGEGTVFEVNLPVSDLADAVAGRSEPKVSPARGTETVLLVEDEPALRRVAKRLLEGGGYRVLEAADGPHAIQALKEAGPAQVLLTDFVLPGGLNGAELAREVAKSQPGIRVIVTSGYNDPAAGHSGGLDPEWLYLQKPVPSRELLAAVRRALDPSTAA